MTQGWIRSAGVLLEWVHQHVLWLTGPVDCRAFQKAKSHPRPTLFPPALLLPWSLPWQWYSQDLSGNAGQGKGTRAEKTRRLVRPPRSEGLLTQAGCVWTVYILWDCGVCKHGDSKSRSGLGPEGRTLWLVRAQCHGITTVFRRNGKYDV